MTTRHEKLASHTLTAIWIGLVATGLVLVVWAAATPEYIDAARANELRSILAPGSQEERDQWFRDMAALRTNKWPLHDAGCGLATLGISVLAVISWFGLRDIQNFRRMSTPQSGWRFLLLGSVIWLAFLPVMAFAVIEDVTRGYAPHWADSIGIPLAGIGASILVPWPFLVLIGWLVFLWGASLPVPLWIWNKQRKWQSVFWTILCALLALPLSLMILLTAIYGPFLAIPLFIVGLYLVLAARAAAISRSMPRAMSACDKLEAAR